MRGSRKSNLAIAFAMAAFECGCAGQHAIVLTAAPRSLSPDLAFASLGPNAPAILSVIERHYANATRQTIALATDAKTSGQNELRVDILGVKNGDVGSETTLNDIPLKEDELLSEAQEALPSVPLRVSLNFVQNRYGPFGYAVGRSSRGDTCVYAWQRLATPEQKLSLINSRVAASVRLRLCASRAAEAALVAPMMNLTVDATVSGGGWTPEPRELSADIGAPGAPTGPPSIMEAFANSPSPKSYMAKRRPRTVESYPARKSEQEAAPASAALQAPPGFVVPPPPVTAPAASTPQVPSAAPPPAPSGARP